MRSLALLALAVLAAPAAHGDPAEIVAVEAAPSADGWRFDVTLSHADTGWDDYADGWRVELPDGTVLATRELLHPHVDQQPFTRSLTGVPIPDGTPEVALRARTSPDGWSDATRTVPLP
jgi:hypothetical protein